MNSTGSIIHGIPEWEHPKQVLYTSTSSCPSSTLPQQQLPASIQQQQQQQQQLPQPQLQRTTACMIQQQHPAKYPTNTRSPTPVRRGSTKSIYNSSDNCNNMDHIHRLNMNSVGITPQQMMIISCEYKYTTPNQNNTNNNDDTVSVGDITWDQTELMAFGCLNNNNNNNSNNYDRHHRSASMSFQQQEHQHPWENFKEIDDGNDIVKVPQNSIQPDRRAVGQQQQQQQHTTPMNSTNGSSRLPNLPFTSPMQRRKNRVFAISSATPKTPKVINQTAQPPQPVQQAQPQEVVLKSNSPIRPSNNILNITTSLSPRRNSINSNDGLTSSPTSGSSRRKDSPLRKLLSRKKLNATSSKNIMLATPYGFDDDDDCNHPLSSSSEEFIMSATVIAAPSAAVASTAPSTVTATTPVALLPKKNTEIEICIHDDFDSNNESSSSFNQITNHNSSSVPSDVNLASLFQQKKLYKATATSAPVVVASKNQEQIPSSPSLLATSPSRSSAPQEGSMIVHTPSQPPRPSCMEYNHLISPLVTSPNRKSKQDHEKRGTCSNSISTDRRSNTTTNTTSAKGPTIVPTTSYSAASSKSPTPVSSAIRKFDDDSMTIKAITTSPTSVNKSTHTTPIRYNAKATDDVPTVDNKNDHATCTATTIQRTTNKDRRYNQKLYQGTIESSFNERKTDCYFDELMDVSTNSEPLVTTTAVTSKVITLQELDESICNLEATLQGVRHDSPLLVYSDDDDETRSIEFNERLVNFALDCSLAFVNDNATTTMGYYNRYNIRSNFLEATPPQRHDSFRTHIDLQTAMVLSRAIMDD